MFKYFKRSNSTSDGSSQHEQNDYKRNSLSLSIHSNDECLHLDEIYNVDNGPYFFDFNSRLSMNLNAIVNENNCLLYFVQFLENKNALPLIRFYLDTVNFQSASEYEPRSKSPDCCSTASLDSLMAEDGLASIGLPNDRCVGADCKTNDIRSQCHNQVPVLENIYDISMQKSLTDDEKSQLFAEKNKREKVINESGGENHSKHTCKTTDAISIYKKYFMPSSDHYVGLPVETLSEISLILCADRQAGGNHKILSTLFDHAQQFILDKLEHEYLNEFLQSELYCKYCVELLSSAEMTIIDILYSESALFYFMEYLEQENQRHILDFWMTAFNFRKQYEKKSISKVDLNEAQADAMILYEKYFSLQADTRLRFSDNIRSEIEESICSNDLNSNISYCFDRPLKIIEMYLEKEFYPGFIESPLYAKYVNELQSKLCEPKKPEPSSQTQRILRYRNNSTQSTNKGTKHVKRCSISQYNTLLAMESHSQKNSSMSDPTHMHIGSRHLNDPDLLYQRNHGTGLKFGRINSLGRYERDFDTCPSSKNWSLAMGSNTIKNVVKKLVNIPEDKIQEEIAWQIAEMIVDDVLSVTMSQNNCNKSA